MPRLSNTTACNATSQNRYYFNNWATKDVHNNANTMLARRRQHNGRRAGWRATALCHLLNCAVMWHTRTTLARQRQAVNFGQKNYSMWAVLLIFAPLVWRKLQDLILHHNAVVSPQSGLTDHLSPRK